MTTAITNTAGPQARRIRKYGFSAVVGGISCIRWNIASWFGAQRSQLLSRLQGDALAEAQLGPEETIEIQRRLKARGWLPTDAAIDGVFGPISRGALTAWQRAAGIRQTGFASSSTLIQLGR